MRSAESELRLQAIQNEILEMIAYGQPLAPVLATLCRRIEELAPEVLCSVLSLSEDGTMHPIAAPSLPEHYSRALDGLAIGPSTGSCGTAMHRGEPVLVTDIASDPLWADYKALALPIGLKACWSMPIKAREGRVIGAFAFYYRRSRGPSPLEERAVEASVHMCAIAIEHAEIQARNHRLAYFDTLTGLPNRFQADTLLKEKLAASPEGLGLLLIDIDNLKVTNDTLGHALGDELIRQVASRLATVAFPGTACRIGGDEFLMILHDCGEDRPLDSVAARVLISMEAAFEFEGNSVVPQVTIGGALFGRDGSDLDTLRQSADLALYHSKENGRGRFVEFNESLRVSMNRRVMEVREVEAALSERRIVAYFQPVVQLRTGRIIGLESLARLITRDGRVVPAGQFAEALKEPRVARWLTYEMLQQITRALAVWSKKGAAQPRVGLNVASADFQGGGLVERILTAFAKEAVPVSRLTLEVTEMVLIGSEHTSANVVAQLRAEGVRVALDDFGTGYASLTHLLTLPVDVLKIDKCFVDRLFIDKASEVIIEALVGIAGKLGMSTVAEGVETAEQAELLRTLGCDYGQGFGLFKPAPLAEVTKLLMEDAHAPRRDARSAA